MFWVDVTAESAEEAISMVKDNPLCTMGITLFVYPLFRLGKVRNLIVMFTAPQIGEVVQQGTYRRPVGYKSDTLTNHEDSVWEPCEDPRQSKTNKMLKAMKDRL